MPPKGWRRIDGKMTPPSELPKRKRQRPHAPAVPSVVPSVAQVAPATVAPPVEQSFPGPVLVPRPAVNPLRDVLMEALANPPKPPKKPWYAQFSFGTKAPKKSKDKALSAVAPVVPSTTTEAPKPKGGSLFSWPKKKQPNEDENIAPIMKKTNVKRMALIIGGLAIAGVSLFPMVLYVMNPRGNVAMAMVGIFGIAVGGGLAYWGLKVAGEANVMLVRPGGVKGELEKPANSMILLPDRIEFANVAEPFGHPRKCQNDGHWYYVFNVATKEDKCPTTTTKLDSIETTLQQFILPDTTYRDPRMFAGVLNLDAHRKLATKEASLLQKIAPWAIVLVIGIEALLFLTFTPTEKLSSNTTVTIGQQQQRVGK